jgi:hypothetical protein
VTGGTARIARRAELLHRGGSFLSMQRRPGLPTRKAPAH